MQSVYLAFLYGPVMLLPLFSFNDSIYVAFPSGRLYHGMVRADAHQRADARVLDEQHKGGRRNLGDRHCLGIVGGQRR